MSAFLKVLSIIMVVLGVVGLVTSLVAFRGVTAQVANIDASVGNVVTLLNNASTGLSDVGKSIKNVNGALDNVGKQIPQVAGGSATTLETASKTIAEARKGATQAEKWVGSTYDSLNLRNVKSMVTNIRDMLNNNVVLIRGWDIGASLIEWAPWLAANFGLDEAALVAQGRDLMAGGQDIVIPLDQQVRVTGDDFLSMGEFLRTNFNVDDNWFRYHGENAKNRNYVWGFHIVETLKQVEKGIDGVDGEFKQVRQTVNSTGTQLDTLSANLGANARDLRAAIPSITATMGQVGQFMGVADKQVEQISQNLKGTAQSLGQVKASALIGSAISGLRWYMVFTYILFILAGVGLFVTSRRLDRMVREISTRAAPTGPAS